MWQTLILHVFECILQAMGLMLPGGEACSRAGLSTQMACMSISSYIPSVANTLQLDTVLDQIKVHPANTWSIRYPVSKPVSRSVMGLGLPPALFASWIQSLKNGSGSVASWQPSMTSPHPSLTRLPYLLVLHNHRLTLDLACLRAIGQFEGGAESFHGAQAGRAAPSKFYLNALACKIHPEIC